jgi:[protein-PII] uridylyltransferase
VANLVEKHLLMSQTAQKKNIDDIEVVDEFAQAVGSVEFLEFLYLLTVADIRSTKADLWNDWKDSLLKKLFYKTKDHLQSGKTELPNINQQIETIKQSVAIEVQRQGYEVNEIENLFATLPKDYFLRYEIDEILWHLGVVIKCQDQEVVVASKISEYNVVDVFVCSKDSKGLFFRLVSIIEKLGLDIVDAKILTTKDHKVYNTISILQDRMFEQININQEIEDELSQSSSGVKEVGVKLSHRYFDYKMRINFSVNKKWNLTQVEISVIDKQGLLSNIAYVFYQLNISIINARIATLGERVEDVFFVSSAQNKPLSKDEERALQRALEERL